MTKKTFSLKKFAAVALSSMLLMGITSCSKEEPLSPPSADKVESSYEVLSNNETLRNATETNTAINEVALDYCNNAKTILYATAAFDPPLSSATYENLMDNSSNLKDNPMSLRLKYLDIIDESTGRPVDFYNLPQEQKEVFVDLLLTEEAKSISSKIEAVPTLKDILKKENNATLRVIERRGLTKLQIGVNRSTLRSVEDIVEVQESADFFRELSEEIEQELSPNTPQMFGSVSFNYPTIPVERVKEAWRRSARRGDFALAIPDHGHPWTFINVGKNVKFKIGHAGIINTNVTYSTNPYAANATIESYKEGGVQDLRVADWDTPHYVMGIQKVKWVWKWRGFRSGLYRVTTPVSNPGALADWAAKYRGHGYVKGYEFATAKWAAPKRFTCTTLVWWCAKKAYGINVSSWYSPLVTPSGLYTDDCTYVRHNVL